MPAPYDSFDYPAYWQKRLFEDQAEKICLKRFLEKIKKAGFLIDVGSGYGRLTYTYLSYCQKILLCDPSENLLALAKKNFSQFKNISFKKTSLPKLDLDSNSCDTILSVRVFHHLKNSNQAIAEINRVLKPGGFLVLEFANKIHFLARVKAGVRGDFKFFKNLEPCEQRSRESIAQRKILFLNHHPKKIINELVKNNFAVEEILSVSNFRNPIIKKTIPLKILLTIEKYTQRGLSLIFFGPSIFILAKKSHNT